MVKDYSVLDGMVTNQRAVLKAAYDRGYSHGLTDGIDRAASDITRSDRKDYDKGYKEGYDAGMQQAMKNLSLIVKPKRGIKMFFNKN